jgi:hypothetical protein
MRKPKDDQKLGKTETETGFKSTRVNINTEEAQVLKKKEH